jgi:NADPH:quinone reductase-like Zn-dependent oxidoreductase
VQAIVQERYGGPEVLVSREIERPGIGDREVLVRVHAAGLHIGDAFGVRARHSRFGSRAACAGRSSACRGSTSLGRSKRPAAP